jgi:hypothetical protein
MIQSLGKEDTKVRDDNSMKPEVKENISKWIAEKKLTEIFKGQQLCQKK